ncbi:MAG: hypothetical protein KDN22_15395 [Verrucomicrobiae bacterium]|nr:hypothetical protein [Verrucomicrobiae bacterium]
MTFRRLATNADDPHLYEFQFGKGAHDSAGPNYGIPDEFDSDRPDHFGDARTTTLDALGLEKCEVSFGYWFDFGDSWFHSVHVDRIEDAIPTVTYPRIGKRVGKSPPQYDDGDS